MLAYFSNKKYTMIPAENSTVNEGREKINYNGADGEECLYNWSMKRVINFSNWGIK